jgi:hypothetical protein
MKSLSVLSAIILVVPALCFGAPALAGLLLGGGQQVGDSDTKYSNFTGSFSISTTSPDAEKIVQTRLPAGTLSKLKLSVFFSSMGGSGTVMIRLNGADTPLTCTATAAGKTGSCNSNATVNVPNNAKLSVRVTNTSGNGSGALFNYSLQFD